MAVARFVRTVGPIGAQPLAPLRLVLGQLGFFGLPAQFLGVQNPTSPYGLFYSTQPSRANPARVTPGLSLPDSVFVFPATLVNPDAYAQGDIASVTFHTDNAQGVTQASAPFDYAGATDPGDVPNPLGLPAGTHTLKAVISEVGGAVYTDEVTVTVTVPAAPPPAPPTGYPDASTTGVPAGTTLTSSGTVSTSSAGQVIQNLSIAGYLNVNHNNVTVRRCRIRGGRATPTVNIASGVTGFVIEDSEIDMAGSGKVGIGYSNWAARRCNIHGGEDGAKMEHSTELRDSYIHHLLRPDTGSHGDCIQSVKGNGITIVHNTLLAYNPTTDDFMNSVLQLTDTTGSADGSQTNVTFTDNLVGGGNYTVNLRMTGTGLFARNRFRRNFRYGPINNMRGITYQAATNVYDDTGQPVR